MSDDNFVTQSALRKRGRPTLGKRAMTDAERMRRHRKLAKHKAKATRRVALIEARDAKVSALAADLAGMSRFNVLYADPPWRFEPYSRETGMDRAADNHYPTMTTAAIKALPVPAADDAVLFLWGTVPMLPEAIDVMRAWGFTYKSACFWVKDRDGTGYWFRNRIELLLVGTRGNMPAPIMGDQPRQVVVAPRGKHSEKPNAFAVLIEDMFPNVPLFEMFARKSRGGRWISWGNEIADAAE